MSEYGTKPVLWLGPHQVQIETHVWQMQKILDPVSIPLIGHLKH